MAQSTAAAAPTLDQIERALDLARADGNAQAVSELEQMLAQARGQQEQGGADWRGRSRALGQGMTFGFSDEIASAAAAMAAAVVNPADNPQGFWQRFRAAYDDISANEREGLQQYRQENPGEALALEVAGGLATGGAAGARGFAAMRNAPGFLGGPVARLAVPGAVEGAAYGAGAADPGERLRGAAVGGAIGGIAAPVAQAGMNAAVRPVKRMLGAGFEAATANPQQRARGLVRTAAEADDIIDPALAAQRLGELGPNATIADLGPNLRGAASGAATRVGPARRILTESLDARQAGQQGRIVEVARQKVGALADDFYGKIDDLTTRARQAAKPLYESAYNSPLTPDRDILKTLRHPMVKDAMRRAGRMLGGGKQGLSVEFLDQTKRALDDDISAAIRTGRNEEARVMMRLKDSLVGWVDKQVPDYAAARAAYAGDAALVNAAEMGVDLVRQKAYAPLVARAVKGMSDNELSAMRMGVLQGIVDTVEDTGLNQNAARRLLRTTRMRNVLRTLFPDEKSFDDFVKAVDAESLFSETRAYVTGGSPTARRLSEMGDAESIDAAGQVLSGNTPGAIISTLRRFFKSEPPPEVLEEVAVLLSKPFSKLSDDELRAIFSAVPKSPSGTVAIATSAGAVGASNNRPE